MSDVRCNPDYYPWFLAWDCNFLPDEEGKHEFYDQGDGIYMIFLASHNINSKCLFVVDHNYEYS